MEKDFAEPSGEEVDKLYSQLDKDAKQGGYNLNPDADFVRGLVKGLLINEKRYGYRACPCRLASGDKAEDLDIICPWTTEMQMSLNLAPATVRFMYRKPS